MDIHETKFWKGNQRMLNLKNRSYPTNGENHQKSVTKVVSFSHDSIDLGAAGKQIHGEENAMEKDEECW